MGEPLDYTVYTRALKERERERERVFFEGGGDGAAGVLSSRVFGHYF